MIKPYRASWQPYTGKSTRWVAVLVFDYGMQNVKRDGRLITVPLVGRVEFSERMLEWEFDIDIFLSPDIKFIVEIISMAS